MEENLFQLGIWVFIVMVLLGGVYFGLVLPRFSPPCIFDRFFGFYCPGCGGTRAVVALLKGQWLRSLCFHPLVLYFAVMYSGFMLSHLMERLKLFHIHGWKFHDWYLYTGVFILAGNFLVKNVLRWFFHIRLL